MGSEVWLHKNSTLPEICVKCGGSIAFGGSYVREKFRWHHPAVYAALISPLIYLILAACLSENIRINSPLCGEHVTKRDKMFTGLFVGGMLATLFICLSAFFGAYGLAVLIFLVALIVISINIEYNYKAFRRARVEGSYYYLKGASDEFLNQLPY